MTPMLGDEPGKKQSPASWAATASSIASTPASIRAVSASRSISIPRMRSVLITIVSSTGPTGAALCPVVWPRTLSSCAAAYLITAAMSAAPSTYATAAGCGSAARFQAWRASSQSGSAGVATRPAMESSVSPLILEPYVLGYPVAVRGPPSCHQVASRRRS